MSQFQNKNLDTCKGNVHLCILLVDDDPSILEVSKSILESEGNFEVDVSYSVDDALQKMTKRPYHAVVSDYDMPQKNGLDFLKELRLQKNGVPFILFTGKGREEVAITALNLGADGYYHKQGSTETVYGELAHGIRISVTCKQAEESARRNEQKRLEQLTLLSDFSRDLNSSGSLDEVCEVVCNKIKEIIGQGYVTVTLIDEAEQSETIKATAGFDDKGMINSAIRLLGGDPRGTVYNVKDMLPEELEQFRSGKLEHLDGGLYALMARKQLKTICRMIERLMRIHFVYTVGFVHKNRQLGGAEIMLNSQIEIQKNKNLIEALMGEASPVISRLSAELKLFESEQRYRIISNLMAEVAFSSVKPEGDNYMIDWITGAVETVFGCSIEDIKKRTYWEFIVEPQDLPLFNERIAQLSPGQSNTCQLRVASADGSTRWIRLFARVEKDKVNPKTLRLFGACENINGP